MKNGMFVALLLLAALAQPAHATVGTEEAGDGIICPINPTRTYLDVTVDAGDVVAIVYNVSGNYDKAPVADGLVYVLNLSEITLPPTVCWAKTDEFGEVEIGYNPNQTGVVNYWFIFCPVDANTPMCLNRTGITSSPANHNAVPACAGYGSVHPSNKQNYLLSHNQFYQYNRTPASLAALCWPLMLIFALLMGAAYAAGKNPFGFMDMSAPRMSRGKQYTMRAQQKNFDMMGVVMAADNAASTGSGGRFTFTGWASGKLTEGATNLMGATGIISKTKFDKIKSERVVNRKLEEREKLMEKKKDADGKGDAEAVRKIGKEIKEFDNKVGKLMDGNSDRMKQYKAGADEQEQRLMSSAASVPYTAMDWVAMIFGATGPMSSRNKQVAEEIAKNSEKDVTLTKKVTGYNVIKLDGKTIFEKKEVVVRDRNVFRLMGATLLSMIKTQVNYSIGDRTLLRAVLEAVVRWMVFDRNLPDWAKGFRKVAKLGYYGYLRPEELPLGLNIFSGALMQARDGLIMMGKEWALDVHYTPGFEVTITDANGKETKCFAVQGDGKWSAYINGEWKKIGLQEIMQLSFQKIEDRLTTEKIPTGKTGWILDGQEVMVKTHNAAFLITGIDGKSEVARWTTEMRKTAEENFAAKSEYMKLYSEILQRGMPVGDYNHLVNSIGICEGLYSLTEEKLKTQLGLGEAGQKGNKERQKQLVEALGEIGLKDFAGVVKKFDGENDLRKITYLIADMTGVGNSLSGLNSTKWGGMGNLEKEKELDKLDFSDVLKNSLDAVREAGTARFSKDYAIALEISAANNLSKSYEKIAGVLADQKLGMETVGDAMASAHIYEQAHQSVLKFAEILNKAEILNQTLADGQEMTAKEREKEIKELKKTIGVGSQADIAEYYESAAKIDIYEAMNGTGKKTGVLPEGGLGDIQKYINGCLDVAATNAKADVILSEALFKSSMPESKIMNIWEKTQENENLLEQDYLGYGPGSSRIFREQKNYAEQFNTVFNPNIKMERMSEQQAELVRKAQNNFADAYMTGNSDLINLHYGELQGMYEKIYSHARLNPEFSDRFSGQILKDPSSREYDLPPGITAYKKDGVYITNSEYEKLKDAEREGYSKTKLPDSVTLEQLGETPGLLAVAYPYVKIQQSIDAANNLLQEVTQMKQQNGYGNGNDIAKELVPKIETRVRDYINNISEYKNKPPEEASIFVNNYLEKRDELGTLQQMQTTAYMAPTNRALDGLIGPITGGLSSYERQNLQDNKEAYFGISSGTFYMRDPAKTINDAARNESGGAGAFDPLREYVKSKQYVDDLQRSEMEMKRVTDILSLPFPIKNDKEIDAINTINSIPHQRYDEWREGLPTFHGKLKDYIEKTKNYVDNTKTAIEHYNNLQEGKSDMKDWVHIKNLDEWETNWNTLTKEGKYAPPKTKKRNYSRLGEENNEP